MDLGSRFNEILEMCPMTLRQPAELRQIITCHLPSQEVAQVHKFTVGRVLHIDDTPAVLAPTNRLSIDENVPLRTHDGKRNNFLQ